MVDTNGYSLVGPASDFPDGELREAVVEGQELLILRRNGEFYISDARCTHLKGRLVRGTLEGTTVTCPLHGSRFDLATGEVVRWTDFSGVGLKIAKAIRSPRPLGVYESKVENSMLFRGPRKSDR